MEYEDSQREMLEGQFILQLQEKGVSEPPPDVDGGPVVHATAVVGQVDVPGRLALEPPKTAQFPVPKAPRSTLVGRGIRAGADIGGTPATVGLPVRAPAPAT